MLTGLHGHFGSIPSYPSVARVGILSILSHLPARAHAGPGERVECLGDYIKG